MATADEQSIRRELSEERERLAEAVDELRTGIGGTVRSKLPLAAAAAFGLGFVKAGGIGATARLARRRREGEQKAAGGRFRLIRRR